MAILPDDVVKLLVCPACTSKFELEVLSSTHKDGVLRCRSGHVYPIIHGLPKILVGGLEGDYTEFLEEYKERLHMGKEQLYSESSDRLESKEVQETFHEKWAAKDLMGVGDSSPYKQFMREWMLDKYGWGIEEEFAAQLKERNTILDAGAGLGREVINLAQAAPHSTVIGLEFSDAAISALKNISSFTNATIIQGDIMKMPFADSSFDFILSEGVLHHTPDTREAFRKCCSVLKKGGEIAFYIYRKKGPLREFADDYLRKNVRSDEKWSVAERITLLGKALSDLKVRVKIPQDIPELGVKSGEMDLQRFIYYDFLKCFWNDRLPFEENVIINFDWYAPKHAHRHTKDEVLEWCRENAVEVIWFHEEDAGYSVRGIKT